MLKQPLDCVEGGLPLALITTGSAMAYGRNRDAWENAVNDLCNCPAEFPDELVDIRIGEGLIRDSHNIAVARVQGKYIIESLILVCLLKEVQTYFGNFVKTHDMMIRDLALWIAYQGQDNKILALFNHITRSHASAIEEFPRHPDTVPLSPSLNSAQLPIEIKECSQLIILLFDDTEKLKAAREGLLRMLSAVQVFSRVPTKIESDFDMLSIFGVSVLLLRELDSSRHIQDVTVVLSNRDSGLKIQIILQVRVASEG
ncbi:hypothetical protein WN943_023610 [Citrus x changshan-huyou]